MKADMKVDRAKVSDAISIHQMISHFADKGDKGGYECFSASPE